MANLFMSIAGLIHPFSNEGRSDVDYTLFMLSWHCTLHYSIALCSGICRAP